uniref:Fatty acid desaturase domain-containing protein n=1 Tax=Terrapene triunguis TaxID=2587831 RepID=A0A674JII0_9SAUR
WEEIGLHMGWGHPQQERWLFYRRHPGGARLISLYAGQECPAFHINKTLMRKSMNLLLIRELAPGQPSFESCKNVKNFHELCATVKRMGLFKPSYLFFFLNFLQILILEAAGWFTLWYIGTSFMPFLTAALLLTTAQVNCPNHCCEGHIMIWGTKSKWNHLCHEFVMCNLKGLSSTWRNRQHNQHHTKTNCFPKDPDILLHPSLFALGKTLSVEVTRLVQIPKQKFHRSEPHYHCEICK